MSEAIIIFLGIIIVILLAKLRTKKYFIENYEDAIKDKDDLIRILKSKLNETLCIDSYREGFKDGTKGQINVKSLPSLNKILNKQEATKMIANELRIGNLVFDQDNKVIEIIALGPLIVSGSRKSDRYKNLRRITHYNWEDIKPLPLSEDLLMKCWFIRFEREGIASFDECNPTENTVWFVKGKFTIVQCGNNTPFFFSNHNLKINLPYFHQLQNLYFAHTSEELAFQIQEDNK